MNVTRCAKRFPVEDFLADMRLHEPLKLGLGRRALPLHRPELSHTVEVGRGQLDTVYVARPRVMNKAIGEEQQRADDGELKERIAAPHRPIIWRLAGPGV
jgi:hypothetical protein